MQHIAGGPDEEETCRIKKVVKNVKVKATSEQKDSIWIKMNRIYYIPGKLSKETIETRIGLVKFLNIRVTQLQTSRQRGSRQSTKENKMRLASDFFSAVLDGIRQQNNVERMLRKKGYDPIIP